MESQLALPEGGAAPVHCCRQPDSSVRIAALRSARLQVR